MLPGKYSWLWVDLFRLAFSKQVTHYLNGTIMKVESILRVATITVFKNSRADGTNGLYVGDILPTQKI